MQIMKLFIRSTLKYRQPFVHMQITWPGTIDISINLSFLTVSPLIHDEPGFHLKPFPNSTKHGSHRYGELAAKV